MEDVTGLDPWGLRRIEHLLAGLEGVDAIKLVPDGKGGVQEIHVLSSSGLGAKQIVRNIESALMAEFSIEIDHRKISVAQVQAVDIPRAEPQPVHSPSLAAAVAETAGREVLLHTFDVERRGGQAICRVKLHKGESEHVAYDSRVRFVISDVSSTQVEGQPLVIALVRAFAGRRSTTLPGVSRVHDSLEEAAILACLDATNRWVGASR
jgi:hypothetical protein